MAKWRKTDVVPGEYDVLLGTLAAALGRQLHAEQRYSDVPVIVTRVGEASYEVGGGLDLDDGWAPISVAEAARVYLAARGDEQPMRSICAWCSRLLAVGPPGGSRDESQVSHGICVKCSAIL